MGGTLETTTARQQDERRVGGEEHEAQENTTDPRLQQGKTEEALGMRAGFLALQAPNDDLLEGQRFAYQSASAT